MSEINEDLQANTASAEKDSLHDRHAPSALYKKQVIQDRITKACYRVLYLPDDKGENKAVRGYWIRIDEPKNTPVSFKPEDVTLDMNIGVMEEISDTFIVSSEDSLSKKSREHRDWAWALIKNIVTIEPDIYEPSKRSDMLKAVETTSGVKVNNIYKYLGKYWRSGFEHNALVPGYSRRGGARPATSLENRSGRHKREGNNGKALDEQDIEYFKKAVRDYYRKGMSITETYKNMLAHYYVRPRFDGDPTPETMGPDEKPSYSQFYYWHRKNRDIVEDTYAREGEHNFNLQHRSILGKTENLLIGPGDCYQMDATIGDFHLVMKSDRSRLVGRPIVVFIKDAWSRMITGMTITLENSSCQVWKEALLNSVTSKVEYCKRFGIEIQPEQWPCCALPVSITTDNGEFAAKEVDRIVKDLGINVEYCPPYRGDLKGIIERTFRTYQLVLKPYIPGYVDKDAGERGAKDYRKDSCLDLETFTAIMINVVLYYNNHHYLDDYPRTDDMRKNGIPSIPLHLWNYGISHRTGTLRTVSPDDYLDALLPKENASITEKGIRINSLFYTCSEAEEAKWFEKARISGNYSIPVRYNPFSLDHVYVKGSDGKYITCSLTKACADQTGYDSTTIENNKENDQNMKAAFTQQDDQAFSNLIHSTENLVKRCKNERANGQEIIKNLNKHSIKSNREEEKKNMSGETDAREAQSGMEADTAESAIPTEEKPKSYQTISNEIDRILCEMGMGTFQNNQ